MESLADRLETIFIDCLYKDEELVNEEEPPTDAIITEGLTAKFAFHPGRVVSHKDDIAMLCNELPDNFQKLGAGGWSFLNLCETKDGELWGQHSNCEQLVVLAIASGQGGYTLPREAWCVLPGSVPYVYFDTQR